MGNAVLFAQLAPEAAVTQQLGSWAAAIDKVSSYARKCRQLPLTAASVCDEVQSLGAALRLAQEDAGYWLDVLCPQLTVSVPQDIQRYSEVFAGQSRRILEGLEQSGNVLELPFLFAELQHELRGKCGRAGSLNQQLTTVLTRFQDNLRAVQSAQAKAAQAVNLDEESLAELSRQYHALCSERQWDSDFTSFLLAPAYESPLISLATVYNPALAPTGEVIRWGVKLALRWLSGNSVEGALRGRIERIENLRRAMNEQQRRVAAIHLLLEAVDSLVAGIESVTQASEQLYKFWKVVESKHTAVLEGFNKGLKAQGLTSVVRIYIETARIAWQQLADYSRGLRFT